MLPVHIMWRQMQLSPEITARLPPQPCPKDHLFDHPCKTLVGTMYFAFGPCNVDDVPEEQMANNTMDVSGWVQTLGLHTVEVYGLCISYG